MNPTATVLRWYRQSTGRASSQPQYTAEEVLQLLRPHADHLADRALDPLPEDQAARSEAVRQVAARPAAWLGALTNQQRREIGDLADRLPSLVYHYAMGRDSRELLERFGGWSTWRYERALDVAAACIASHLNSHSAAP